VKVDVVTWNRLYVSTFGKQDIKKNFIFFERLKRDSCFVSEKERWKEIDIEIDRDRERKRKD